VYRRNEEARITRGLEDQRIRRREEKEKMEE
jgi:hypothetical protein